MRILLVYAALAKGLRKPPSADAVVARLAAAHLAIIGLATWGALALAESAPPDPASPQAPPSVEAPPLPTPGQGQPQLLRERLQRQAFDEADRNGDGLLSKEEAAALPGLRERFDRVDANRDGRVSREELRAAGGP